MLGPNIFLEALTHKNEGKVTILTFQCINFDKKNSILLELLTRKNEGEVYLRIDYGWFTFIFIDQACRSLNF